MCRNNHSDKTSNYTGVQWSWSKKIGPPCAFHCYQLTSQGRNTFVFVHLDSKALINDNISCSWRLFKSETVLMWKCWKEGIFETMEFKKRLWNFLYRSCVLRNEKGTFCIWFWVINNVFHLWELFPPNCWRNISSVSAT